MIHVLPIRDTRPHSRTTDCPCGPALDFDAPEIQVVHNAFDQRENREKTGAPAGGWICSTDCQECDGTGKDNLIRPCFQCDGTGENPLFDPCPECQERGLHVDLQTGTTQCLMCRRFIEPTRFRSTSVVEPRRYGYQDMSPKRFFTLLTLFMLQSMLLGICLYKLLGGLP